jgi:hypothetical protein
MPEVGQTRRRHDGVRWQPGDGHGSITWIEPRAAKANGNKKDARSSGFAPGSTYTLVGRSLGFVGARDSGRISCDCRVNGQGAGSLGR